MRITEQEKLNENAGTAFLTGMFFSMIFAQIGLRLADQGVGLLDSDQYLNLFHPILVRRCKAIAKEHAEELEGLSAQSATKYLGKIIKEEDPGLWDKLGALRGGYNDGWNIRQIAVGKRSGPSNKEKLSQIKARYGESTDKVFDRVFRENYYR